ncbi:MAG: NTP transferase domain-containing protein, partial [Myxococcota bacterium]
MRETMAVVLAAGKGTRMKSDLPKVLHEVHGVPMVKCCINALEEAGVTDVTAVVGYRRDLVEQALGDTVQYAYQEQQRGTGDAVAAAKEQIRAHGGKIVVVYGDNPLLSPDTVRKLIEATDREGVAGAVLTFALENPPQAGRIIRDETDAFIKIIEEQDCTPEQKLINEVNVGTYCFEAGPLLEALDKLEPSNNQGEYYLTDVPEHLVKMGHLVAT